MAATLIVAADGGSSLGKSCYEIAEEKGPSRKGWLTQANAVDEERARDLTPDSCVVEVKNRVWTVGESARYGPFHETNPRAPKINTASIRVLGMLGKVIEREQFTEGNLDLRILLPVGERKSFTQLETTLTKALYAVTLNGLKPKLRLKRIRVYPEGSGVASSISVPDAIVLMFGHKDISLLPVVRGVIQMEACQTITGMGMIALINEFPCNVNDELLLAEFLHLEAVGKHGLARLLGSELLTESQTDFQKAKVRTWRRIVQRFEMEPRLKTAAKIYVTGGSMRVWLPELRALFGHRLAFFGDPLKEMVATYPDMQQPENKEIKPRFTDSFLLMMKEYAHA